MKRGFYSKYGWIYIVIALLFWIILTPSHFQKGGVGSEFYYFIVFFVVGISLLITLMFNKFSILERLLVSLPFALVALFLTTMACGPFIVEFFHGDKTWVLYQWKNRIIVNAFYYGLNSAVLTLLSIYYFKIRLILVVNNSAKKYINLTNNT